MYTTYIYIYQNICRNISHDQHIEQLDGPISQKNITALKNMRK